MVNFEQKMRMPYAKSSFLKVHRGNVAKVIILARLSHFLRAQKGWPAQRFWALKKCDSLGRIMTFGMLHRSTFRNDDFA